MTAIELFRALRDSETGADKLAVLRKLIKDKPTMTGDELLVEMRVVNVTQGTLRKAMNLVAGKPADAGSKIKPAEWVDEIDGKWTEESPPTIKTEPAEEAPKVNPETSVRVMAPVHVPTAKGPPGITHNKR